MIALSFARLHENRPPAITCRELTPPGQNARRFALAPPNLEARHDASRDRFRLERSSMNPINGRRSSPDVRPKAFVRLTHVDPDADDEDLSPRAFKRTFTQDPGELSLVHIEVVRPSQVHVEPADFVNRFRRRDRSEKRQERGREVTFGPEEDAQIEATWGRFPASFETSTSATLLAREKETSVRRRVLRVKKRQVVRGNTAADVKDEGAETGTLGS